ncbi:MAG: NAD-dependent epimerase/dehydratase family protein [Actinomycetes bacterium]
MSSGSRQGEAASTVLVTGVSRELGARFARHLAADSRVERIVGVDVIPPPIDLGRVEFVRADIRNPAIGAILQATEADTVVHMNVLATPVTPAGARSRATMKEINVIGTMQLLAACQKAPRVRRLVVKSSTSVYGASASDPAFFTEEMAPRRAPRTGYAKDSVEVEGYVRGFSRRRPDVQVCLLRLANVLGPRVRTALSELLSLPAVPTAAGFDPRLQFVHEDDALEVLRLATHSDAVGAVNVAGDGVVMLSQLLHRLGRVPLPVPRQLGGTVAQLLRRSGQAEYSAEHRELLTFGRVVDTTRMRRDLGFEPAYSTAETVAAFARSHRGRSLVSPDAVHAALVLARALVVPA